MGLGVINNLDKILANLNSTAKIQQTFDITKYICVFFTRKFKLLQSNNNFLAVVNPTSFVSECQVLSVNSMRFVLCKSHISLCP